MRETGKDRRDLKFTNLLHHITPELLEASFHKLRKKAAVGVDGVSWHEYETGLVASTNSVVILRLNH